MSSTTDLPSGDVQFYDNYIPALAAGDYSIAIDHSLDIAPDTFSALQNFTVKGPQFTLPNGDVCSVFPPANTSGQFAENLPHIVLSKRVLPWERELKGIASGTPWMCLLSFNENELTGVSQDTKTSTVTVSSLLQAADGIVKPNVIIESDISPTATCQVVLIPGSIFKKILPSTPELRYLSHVRQVNTNGQEDLGLKDNGWFSVVIGNRFPDVGDPSTGQGAKNIVHLVSIEGFEDYLNNPSNIDESKQYQLVSLSSWSYTCLPDKGETFHDLMENFVSAEALGPDNLLLKLPLTMNDTSAEGVEIQQKIKKGYVPLAYKTASGENTMSWYRGPLLPEKTTIFQKTVPFSSSSAATIYDSSYGLFDQSLAAAWQIGRSIALSDKVFSQTLFQFRKNANQSIDLMQERSASPLLSVSYKPSLSALATGKPLKQQVTEFLNNHPEVHFTSLEKKKSTDRPKAPVSVKHKSASFFSRWLQWILQLVLSILGIHKNNKAKPIPSSQEQGGGTITSNATNPATPIHTVLAPHKALMTFMQTPGLDSVLQDTHADDIDTIGNWLADLHSLKKIPFAHLVPDPKMLPVESLRFFYVDANWLEAAVDGALSIGAHSSRDTVFIQMMKGAIRTAINTALQTRRSAIAGTDISIAGTDAFNLPLTGLLIRSAVVSGWPGLVVNAFQNKALLKTERMERLAPNILLCMFSGIPDQVVISEPQHSLRFGIDDTGSVELRSLSTPVGHSLGKTLLVRKLDPTVQGVEYMRKDSTGKSTRVLDILPDANTPSGLIKAMADQLQTTITTFGPADFAIQMVQAPEELTFNALSGS